MTKVSPACLDGRVSTSLDAARHERIVLQNQPRSYRAEFERSRERSRDSSRTLRVPAKAGTSLGQAPSRRGPPPSRGIRLAGYAALFGISDADRDTILPGAFAASLAARTGRLPLYWQHRPGQRIGWVETCGEDAKGLRVIATLDPGTRPAQLLSEGEVSGLSFGYRARDFRITPQGRELAAVELFEVSLVTHPLQHGARVHFVC